MTTLRKNAKKFTELPPLPAEAVTRSGSRFTTDSDRWPLHSQSVQSNLDFKRYYALTAELLHSFKLVMLWYIENKSLNHVSNIAYRFSNFTEFVSTIPQSINSISANNILNYRASLQKREEYYLGTLAGFFKKWHALGYPGVGSDVVKILGQIRLRGNTTGEAVRTMDPDCGPFSDIELESIHYAANNAYADGEISLEDYVLLWLFSAIGARAVQYASLKVKDFAVLNDKNGVLIYTLMVPRAKQRHANSRDLFKERSLIPQIGELLAKHNENIKTEYRNKVCNLDELPLFPNREKSNEIPGFEYHLTSRKLTSRIQMALTKMKVISERTGEKIKITSRRFRYTLGTRAAMEGAGELVIAELLDHSDTQYAGVYVQTRPEIVERIDKAMALQLAPMAQAFCGMLIDTEKEALRGDDPASRVIDRHDRNRHDPVGNCGKHGFCGFAAPVACYTCRNFQPWLDGPHEAVLDRLLQERNDIQARGGDLRIASVNDRTIYAVAEVVKRCREIKAAKGF